MSLKIYVAAPFVHKADAAAAKAKFEEAGFQVPARWINEDLGLTNDDVGKPEYETVLQNRAIEDMEDVIASDVLVLLNLAKSEGKATEFGAAYILGIPVVVVGPKTGNIFYTLPGVFHADTIDAAVEGIKRVGGLEIVEGNDDIN